MEGYKLIKKTLIIKWSDKKYTQISQRVLDFHMPLHKRSRIVKQSQIEIKFKRTANVLTSTDTIGQRECSSNKSLSSYHHDKNHQ